MLNGLNEEYINENEENDLFGTYNKATTIKNFLELEENREILSINNMIALYGEWGSGKSSVLSTVKDNIDKNKFDVIWFDTWKYEKDNNILYSLLKYIFTNGNENYGKKTKMVLSAFSALLVDAKGLFPFMELNADPKKIRERFKEEMDNNKCYWEKIKDFEKEFNNIKLSGNKRTIVILDDLDRCESENIINLLGAVKQLLSINKNVIFIFGIDRDAVTLALQNKYGNDYNKANEYLEKIFPINFEINAMINNDKFIKYICDITNLEEKYGQSIVKLFYSLKITNPRHIKKILRKYYFMKNYLIANGIEISNKYVVSIKMYVIALNIYSEKDYRMIFEDKEIWLNNYTLHGRDENNHIEYEFNINNIICNCISAHKVEKYDFFPLLLDFTHSHSISNSIITYGNRNNKFITSYFDWKNNFEKGISIDFLDYIFSDKEFIDFFYNNSQYKKDEIQKAYLG